MLAVFSGRSYSFFDGSTFGILVGQSKNIMFGNFDAHRYAQLRQSQQGAP